MKAIQVDDKFIEQYQDFIYSTIRKAGIHNQEIIDDLFGNTIIRIMETSKKYNKDKGAVTTWLKYQVKSVIANYFTRMRRKEDALDKAVSFPEGVDWLDLEIDNNDEVQEDDGVGLAYDMIFESGLSSEDKKFLYDHFIAGFSLYEIAKSSGKAYTTTASRLDRCIKSLQREYD